MALTFAFVLTWACSLTPLPPHTNEGYRYFAQRAAYVDKNGFTHKILGTKHRQMFLAHVLCGDEFDFGTRKDRQSRQLKRPPQRSGSTDPLADSVKVRVDWKTRRGGRDVLGVCV
jgi:hypothetical protein